jgi:hypothetical protein
MRNFVMTRFLDVHASPVNLDFVTSFEFRSAPNPGGKVVFPFNIVFHLSTGGEIVWGFTSDIDCRLSYDALVADYCQTYPPSL